MKPTVIKTLEVFKSTNYEQFKLLHGNRERDQLHIQSLVHAMEEKSINLTEDEPIEVNARMEVLDGQHRLGACQVLNLPVYYVVKSDKTIDEVRAQNSGRKNWNWRDFMSSYAKQGNQNYIYFKALTEEFEKYSFTIIMAFTGQRRYAKSSTYFNSGKLELNKEQYERTREALQRYTDLRRVTRHHTREFALAYLDFMSSDLNYDHQQMLTRAEKYRKAFLSCYYVTDYFYKLEEIYRRA